jgi:SCY1-like protein 2
MPLIYNSLECDNPPVQEKALNAIPSLCEALPYDVLEQVLLVKVAVSLTFAFRFQQQDP